MAELTVIPHGGSVVFILGFAAAVSLAAGYVLQQRVAAHASRSKLLSYRLLRELMQKPVWWGGIGCMMVGQVLGGLALSLGSVALVEPMLASSLFFAFVIAATLSHERVKRPEIAGALLICAALGLFIAIGNPRSAPSSDVEPGVISLTVGLIAAAVLALVLWGKRRGQVGESVLLALGAGILYGLQDAGTRAALVVADHHGIARMLLTPWPYVVVAVGAVGLLLSQSAFRAARLDYSLPPIAVAEPVVGIALGVSLLGDLVSVSVLGLAVEAGCLAAMIAGVVLIGRSSSLATCGARDVALLINASRAACLGNAAVEADEPADLVSAVELNESAAVISLIRG